MDITKDFLKCTLCNKYFFTQTGFKLHNNEEHHSNEQLHNNKEHPQEKLTIQVSRPDKRLDWPSQLLQNKAASIGKENIIDEKSKLMSTAKNNTDCLADDFKQLKECSILILTVVEETEKSKAIEELSKQDSKTKESQDMTDTVSKQKYSSFTNQITDTERPSNQTQACRISTPIETKKHQCEICKKSFARRYNLCQHIKVLHEKIISFQCQICQKNFVAKNSLHRHIKVLHEKNQVLSVSDL
jgi:hypothetical protein